MIFGMNTPGGPRQSLAQFQTKTARIILGEVTSDLYTGTTHHWPDEVEAGDVRYEHRFAFTALGAADGVPLDPNTGPLDADTVAALRKSGPGNSAYLSAHADVADLAELLGVALDPSTGIPNIGAAPALTNEPNEVDDDVSAFAGPGRSSDPELRKVVEERAVLLAKRHMIDVHGWVDVRELGKPYDLVCTNGTAEKHVEVKGTTGAGGAVEYTTNEVDHFRNCPHGADLVVVREIVVDRSSRPYVASGGHMMHEENYRAPEADLQTLKYQGKVRW